MENDQAIENEKIKLRSYFLSMRSKLNDETLRENYRSIANSLVSCVADQKVEKLFIFWPKKHEIDLRILIYNSDCDIYLPRMTGERGVMNFHKYSSESELEINRFGIWEPKADSPIESPSAASLIVVPALAVDEAGYRIGYGGGYYDRYLGRYHCRTIACVLEQFFVKQLPSDFHDIRVDGVVTEAQLKWLI